MKFLADENLYEPVISYLRKKGYEVFSVRESGFSGRKSLCYNGLHP